MQAHHRRRNRRAPEHRGVAVAVGARREAHLHLRDRLLGEGGDDGVDRAALEARHRLHKLVVLVRL